MRHVLLLFVIAALGALVAVSQGQGTPTKGYMDCDGAVDALRILRHVAGLPPLPTAPGCPDIGPAPSQVAPRLYNTGILRPVEDAEVQI